MKTNNQPAEVNPENIFLSFLERKGKAFKEIQSVYNRIEWKPFYQTYDNVVTLLGIHRYINVVHDILGMQIILGKDIYIPGVGLFSIKEPLYKGYKFTRDFQQIPFSKRHKGSKTTKKGISYPYKIITENGKLSYDLHETLIMNVVLDGKMRLLRSVQTKNDILSNIISQFVGAEKLEIELVEPYTGPNDYESVMADFVKHKDTWEEFITDIDISSLLCHPQIIKDIFVICSYIYGKDLPR